MSGERGLCVARAELCVHYLAGQGERKKKKGSEEAGEGRSRSALSVSNFQCLFNPHPIYFNC